MSIAPDGATGRRAPGFEVPPVVLLDGGAAFPHEVLGNKGYGINVMRRNGLPVPSAFCITTEVCRRHLADPQRTLDAIWDAVLQAMSWLEAESEHTFGRGPRPLLVSVRSGAVESMPGMLDTVLDLGINDEVRDALATSFTPAFADDTRTRFVGCIAVLCSATRTGRSPMIRTRSCGVPSRPSSILGTRHGRSPTAAIIASTPTRARRWWCRRWSSATWTRPPREPESCSPATR